MKKLLILGGSPFQVPPIEYARSAGYYVITCDYLPDNPGHRLSHEYHNVSTTDLNAVLDLSVARGIDGILAYASDPAAPTAAFVATKLGLPGNPYDSVCTMAHKDRYRQFLVQHGFHAPKSISLPSTNGFSSDTGSLRLPVMVKPVDSSGSKGVSKITTREALSSAINEALRFSRCKRVIVEEYISRKGPQIGGEAFVVNGRVTCMCLGDQLVDEACNPYVPTGMTFPSRISAEVASLIRQELQRLLDALQFSGGGLNLEIMLDAEDKIHLMEVGPRTGGNYLPELVHYGTGYNLAACSVETALGHTLPEHAVQSTVSRPPSAFAYYAVHSRRQGVLRSVNIDGSLKGNIVQEQWFRREGDTVEPYNGSNHTIGILLLRFESHDELRAKMTQMDTLVTTVVR